MRDISHVSAFCASRLVLGWMLVCICAAPAVIWAEDLSPESINSLLQAGDVASVDRAIDSIRGVLSERPEIARGQIRSWADALRGLKRFDAAADLTTTGVTEFAADIGSIESLLQLRIRILLEAGRPKDALRTAKSLFNVSRMETTAMAIRQVAECLNAVSGGNDAPVEQFRQEQLAGATPQPEATSRLATPAVAASARSSILGQIHPDADSYKIAIRQLDPRSYLFPAAHVPDLLAVGNLLLVSDRADEALAAFTQAGKIARVDQMLAANEGIARAIKAQDGTIGRANAWVRRISPRAP